MSCEKFFRRHAGSTCLIVCNGISIRSMPLEFLRRYPSFGCNTIFKLEGFEPWYYAASDDRNREMFGEEIVARFGSIPKFVPTPNLDAWQGPEFHRFKHTEGAFFSSGLPEAWTADLLETRGIHYSCTPHILMQLAFFMGFTTMLIVGMDHRSYGEGYFWGVDEPILNGRSDDVRFRVWEKGHKMIFETFRAAGVRMLNLTPDSLAEAIPHDDWKKW